MTRITPPIRKTGKRQPSSPLPAILDKNLLAYAAAASATGIGILACAVPSNADIIFTPTHVNIVQNGEPVPLDLNNDGIVDFQFVNFESRARPPLGTMRSYLIVEPMQQSNGIIEVESKGGMCAAALPNGARIGTARAFALSGLDMAHEFADSGGVTFRCPWLRKTGAYVGLKFSIDGATHYGWARVRVDGFKATLTGYAYETVANKKIVAGKTSGPDDVSLQYRSTPSQPPQALSLGYLALGTSGLAIWRREEEAIAQP